VTSVRKLAREKQAFPSPQQRAKRSQAKTKTKKGIIIKRQKRETTHPKQRKTRTDNRYVELLGRLGVGHEGEHRGEDGEREREGDAVEVRAAMT
jgi:hypothetical protein